MSKKRKVDLLQEALDRSWCYYCERTFTDMKVLIDHQKAKHYQCHVGNCHRRLNTVGGLRVHMAQVHKEELHEVPNALDHRKSLDLEIFGMEGVPEHLIQQEQDKIRREFHHLEAEHMRKTGNPLSGSAAARDRNEAAANKKPKIEGKEDLKRRVAEAKAKKEAIKRAKELGLPPSDTTSSTPPGASTPQSAQDVNMQKTPTPPAQIGYGAPPSHLPQPPVYNSSSPVPPMGAPTAAWPPPTLPNYPGAPPLPSFPGAPTLPPGFPPAPYQHPGALSFHGSPPAVAPSGYPPGFPPGFQPPGLPAMSPVGNPYAAPQMPVPARQGIIRDPASSPASQALQQHSTPKISKEEVSAGIDELWDTLAAQKAADVSGGDQTTKDKPVNLPNKVQTPVIEVKAEANEQPPKTPATEKGKGGNIDACEAEEGHGTIDGQRGQRIRDAPDGTGFYAADGLLWYGANPGQLSPISDWYRRLYEAEEAEDGNLLSLVLTQARINDEETPADCAK